MSGNFLLFSPCPDPLPAQWLQCVADDSSNKFPNTSLMFPEIVNCVIFTLALNYSNILPLILVHIAILWISQKRNEKLKLKFLHLIINEAVGAKIENIWRKSVSTVLASLLPSAISVSWWLLKNSIDEGGGGLDISRKRCAGKHRQTCGQFSWQYILLICICHLKWPFTFKMFKMCSA